MGLCTIFLCVNMVPNYPWFKDCEGMWTPINVVSNRFLFLQFPSNRLKQAQRGSTGFNHSIEWNVMKPWLTATIVLPKANCTKKLWEGAHSWHPSSMLEFSPRPLGAKNHPLPSSAPLESQACQQAWLLFCSWPWKPKTHRLQDQYSGSLTATLAPVPGESQWMMLHKSIQQLPPGL